MSAPGEHEGKDGEEGAGRHSEQRRGGGRGRILEEGALSSIQNGELGREMRTLEWRPSRGGR